MLFGQEGPGLSEEARELCDAVLHIRQFGSTRSINAAAASAVAMHEWIRRYAGMSLPPGPTWPRAVQTLAWVTRPGPFMKRCQERYGDAFTITIGQEPPWVMLVATPTRSRRSSPATPRSSTPGRATRCCGRWWASARC